MGQTQAVKLPQSLEVILASSVGGEEFRILSENSLGSTIQAEVSSPSAEVVSQLVIFVLALLPTGRYSSDRALDSLIGNYRGEGWVKALRPKENDRHLFWRTMEVSWELAGVDQFPWYSR